jgi:hypothetical protein
MQTGLLALLRSATFTYAFSLTVGVLVTYVLAQFDSGTASDGVMRADNTLLTISMITREAMRILENNLAFTKRVNRQYDDKFAIEGAKIGYVVNARKPVRYTVSTGQALSLQDATETQVPVSLTTQDHVDFQFSSADLKLSIDDFGDRFIQPAVAALANKIDYNGLQLYKQVYNSVSTLDASPPVSPIATPTQLLVYLMAGVMLDNNAAPQDELRHLVITPKMQAFIVDALKGLFQQATAISQQYSKGQMGTAAGFQWAMDQNCPTHVSGIYTGAVAVNATANQTGAALGVTVGTSYGFVAGDIFTIAGVYSVNPQSRQSTGQLQQFTLTAGAAGTTTGTLAISPPIITSGPMQTVSNSPAATAVITFVNAAGATGTSNPLGLAFHRDAFTLVTADLPVPKGTDMASRVSDKQLGISLRIVRDYDITTDQFPCRIDVLYGWATLRPELACRVYSA